MEDEEGLYHHATESQADQQEQNVLDPRPLLRWGRLGRQSGVDSTAVHHKHRGVRDTTFCHDQKRKNLSITRDGGKELTL